MIKAKKIEIRDMADALRSLEAKCTKLQMKRDENLVKSLEDTLSGGKYDKIFLYAGALHVEKNMKLKAFFSRCKKQMNVAYAVLHPKISNIYTSVQQRYLEWIDKNGGICAHFEAVRQVREEFM